MVRGIPERWSTSHGGAVVTALAVALTVLLTPVAIAGASAAAVPARIVARPRSVMVNSATRLSGTGFAPHATLALRECSSTNWIVPQSPCATGSETVTTDAAGSFKTTFKVSLCPRRTPPPGPVTSETCYIGAPKPAGIDTIELVGAARITVTYP